MNDRPTDTELLAAARTFLEMELIPNLSDARLKFQTLVAANVLAIVERELKAGDETSRQEWKVLAEKLDLPDPPEQRDKIQAALLQANEQLCQRIRHGDYDEPARFAELLEQLVTIVEWKLAVANPRYLSASKRTGQS